MRAIRKLKDEKHNSMQEGSLEFENALKLACTVGHSCSDILAQDAVGILRGARGSSDSMEEKLDDCELRISRCSRNKVFHPRYLYAMWTRCVPI